MTEEEIYRGLLDDRGRDIDITYVNGYLAKGRDI